MLEKIGIDTGGFSGQGNTTAVGPNIAAQVAQAVNANQGIINLSKGVMYNVYPMPTSLTYSVSSNNGGGAASTTVYGFNNGTLNPAVTTNGSGAASIVNTFGDGLSGRQYANLALSANAGMGIKILGFTIQASNYTSGVATPSAFSTLNLTVITQNGYGATVPQTIDLNQALRNTQYNSGMLTLVYGFYLNSLTQLQMVLPVNTSLVFTLFTEASGFTG